MTDLWKPTEYDKRLFEMSRAAFDKYAALDGDPREAGLNELQCVQVDLMRWARTNFGLQPITYMALGIAEEAGELAEALEDVAKYGGDPTNDAIRDACADILVYACNDCTTMRLDFDQLSEGLPGYNELSADYVREYADNGDHSDEEFPWTCGDLDKAVGRLAHVTLKTEQKIRGYNDANKSRFGIAQALSRVIACVLHVGEVCEFNIRQAFIATTTEVMQRDWKNDRETAGGHV